MTYRPHNGAREGTAKGKSGSPRGTAANKVTIREGFTPTYAEKVEQLKQIFRTDGQPRTTVGDLCDTCFQSIRVRRGMLKMRAKGWRFMCFPCWREKGKPSCRTNKLFLGS